MELHQEYAFIRKGHILGIIAPPVVYRNKPTVIGFGTFRIVGEPRKFILLAPRSFLPYEKLALHKAKQREIFQRQNASLIACAIAVSYLLPFHYSLFVSGRQREVCDRVFPGAEQPVVDRRLKTIDPARQHIVHCVDVFRPERAFDLCAAFADRLPLRLVVLGRRPKVLFDVVFDVLPEGLLEGARLYSVLQSAVMKTVDHLIQLVSIFLRVVFLSVPVSLLSLMLQVVNPLKRLEVIRGQTMPRDGDAPQDHLRRCRLVHIIGTCFFHCSRMLRLRNAHRRQGRRHGRHSMKPRRFP